MLDWPNEKLHQERMSQQASKLPSFIAAVLAPAPTPTRWLLSHVEDEVCCDRRIDSIDERYPSVKTYGDEHGQYPDNLNINQVLRAGAALALCDEVDETPVRRTKMIDALLRLDVTKDEAERIVPAAMLDALQNAQFTLATHMASVLRSDELRARVETQIADMRIKTKKRRVDYV